MSQVNVLIVTGDGINCEKETALAFTSAGANSSIVHINDLLEDSQLLDGVHVFVIPGGFSFGDEIRSGRIMALKLKTKLVKKLEQHLNHKGAILGICNGFQVLVELGLLPNRNFQKNCSLMKNESSQFINRWERLEISINGNNPWFDREGELDLPIRHGEGRFWCEDIKTVFEIEKKAKLVIKYKNNPNGSMHDIAGISDDSGFVLGLMPHPEAAYFSETKDINRKNLESDLCASQFFMNVVNFYKENKDKL